MIHRSSLPLLLALGLFSFSSGLCSDLKEVMPLTDRFVLLRFEDGDIEYHKRGEPRSNDKVTVDPLDAVAADKTSTYEVASEGDPDYSSPRHPVSVGRKSKGIEFAWFVDRMVDGVVKNKRPDHVLGHWIYLELPTPLKPGQTYTVATGQPARRG